MKKDKKITISDVAEHADISKSTVSQYLNKRFEYMGEDTKKRINDSITELGYSPNFLARSLKQKKTFTIGIIVANILHGFSTHVIRAIEDACNQQNIHVIVCNTDENAEKEQKYIRMLLAKQVDGFIIFPTGENVEIYKELLDQKIPLTFVDRIIPELKISTVLTDNERASEIAVENFVSNGHRDIAFAVPPLKLNLTPRIERLSGFKKAMKKYNVPIKEEYLISHDLQTMKHRLKDLFQSKTQPTALLASNDLTLIEILNFCKEEKVKLPDDLSIISIDDMPLASVYNPSISSIEQPAFTIGEKAAFLLFDQMNDKEVLPEIQRFAPKFFERETVKNI